MFCVVYPSRSTCNQFTVATAVQWQTLNPMENSNGTHDRHNFPRNRILRIHTT